MEIDWIEWTLFLEMLSVERTSFFITELALPLEQEHFSQVMRLARACLEVHMYTTINVAEDNPEFPGLTEAWRNYRQIGGVLSDEALHDFGERYGRSELAAQAVYSELQGWIGSDTANALKRWFVTNYRSSPDPVWQWPWALRLLICEHSDNIKPTSPAPITRDEQQSIREFCARYSAKQRALELRFYAIVQAAKSEGPTAWERVLQTFPAGGMGNRYPWLDSIRQCLWLQLIRNEWGNLKTQISPNTMISLVEWIREQANVLPFKPTLPEEPDCYEQGSWFDCLRQRNQS